MEFDKSKVYTALNADEVKIGSKGYFYDDLVSLEQAVKGEYKPHVLNRIREKDYAERFENQTDYEGYALFYLVEEPAEKKLRPYKDVTEMFNDFKKRFCPDCEGIPMVWVKSKSTDNTYQVSGFSEDEVYTMCWYEGYDLKELLVNCTYPDGTPCGMEE